MGIKFIKKKKSEMSAASPASELKTMVDKDGKVEIVSKNFTMTASQQAKQKEETAQGETWTCWGCGHINSGEACEICGKRRAGA